jgi:hypothetical protein
MKIAIIFFSSLLIMVLVSTCYYDSQEFLFPQISSQCDSTGTISYASVDSILQVNCMSCHDGPSSSSGLDLSGYEGVHTYATTLRSGTPILQGALRRMNGFQPMPQAPAPALDVCGVRIIELWIEQGAQQQ